VIEVTDEMLQSSSLAAPFDVTDPGIVAIKKL